MLNAYKMESTVKNRVENIWVEILSAKHKYTLGAIYRHPNQNISDFSRLLDSNLCRLDNSRDPCIIVGNLNIDLCKYSTHGPTKDYINNLLSNNFLPHIIMPTHYVGNSATIIDHIYFREGSVHDTVVNSGNLWCDETDHFPNYIIFQTDKILKNEHARPLIRLQSPRNMQTFQTLVSNVDWSDIYYCQDANEAFDKFENHLTACYEESFPLIRLSRRRARDKKWITPGIKASVRKKSKLYKKWIASGNESDGLIFKTYRKYSNLFLKKQKTSIIVRYLILSVTLSSSCGLTSTAIFHYPKPKLIFLFLNSALIMLT